MESLEERLVRSLQACTEELRCQMDSRAAANCPELEKAEALLIEVYAKQEKERAG